MRTTDANEHAEPDADGLLIGDLVKHLSRLAAVEQNERTGNPSLSRGLTLLARCLNRHGSRPVTELAELRLGHFDRPRTRPTRTPAVELPDCLESLDNDQIIAILENDKYQKKQLVELGSRRLGIPRGKLSRLKRSDAVASIRAALDNELALDAIARLAHLEGQSRTG